MQTIDKAKKLGWHGHVATEEGMRDMIKIVVLKMVPRFWFARREEKALTSVEEELGVFKGESGSEVLKRVHVDLKFYSVLLKHVLASGYKEVLVFMSCSCCC